MLSLLDIINLHAGTKEKKILNGVNLSIDKQEVHIILGPNGSGKTTLARVIMGSPNFIVYEGDIVFEGKSIINLPVHERARMGIAMTFQSPPEIEGVKLNDLMCATCDVRNHNKRKGPFCDLVVQDYLQRLEIPHFAERDVNVGFSGGEVKRSELAQVFTMHPKLLILDEPDSGVDIDSLKLLGKAIERYVSLHKTSLLIITHHKYILEHIKPNKIHIMKNGRFVFEGGPEYLDELESVGYVKFLENRGITA